MLFFAEMVRPSVLSLLVVATAGWLGSCLGDEGSPDGPPDAGGSGSEAIGGEAPGGAAGMPMGGGSGEEQVGGALPLGGEPWLGNSAGQGWMNGGAVNGGGAPSRETIRIASFNIQNFGPTKIGRPEVMAELVDIVRRYPFVAVQEVSDVRQEVPFAFLDMVNADEAGYGMLLSPRSGEQPDDKTYQEQYAFYYDATTIEPMSEARLYDDATNDFFVREPYLAQFRVLEGGLSFVAITVHTQPDNAIAEIGHIQDVVEWAKDQYPDEDDYVILGDLNAGCSYASTAKLNLLGLRTSDYVWLVPDTADTNLASSSCAYDRIIVTSATQTNYYGEWGIDSSFTNTMVSDHWPVWAEFWADER